jgi:hypothetical protein
MQLELPIQPRRSCLLCSNAQEIGACIADDAVEVVSVVAVNVVTVTVMAITVVTVSTVTVQGFEWPTPTHASMFSILTLKSKLEM